MAGRKKLLNNFHALEGTLGTPFLSHVSHVGVPSAPLPGHPASDELSCSVAACSVAGQFLLLGSDPA